MNLSQIQPFSGQIGAVAMWVRIDDHVPQHPKFLQAGREAAWFWVCGNCYCNKYLTDGFIAEHALSALSPGAPFRRLTARLLEAGLWERTEGGYTVHDFHDHNPRAEHVKAKREQDRLRKRGQGDTKDPIPETFHAESDATPDGIQSARGRGGASVRGRDPDPVPSQSPPVPEVRTRGTSLLAGTLPRDHARHSWCSNRGKCVPDFLHAEFCRSVNSEFPEKAHERLKAFYEAVQAGWPAGAIGDDPVKLWRREFAAKFPSVAPMTQAKSAGNDASLAQFIARHGGQS